MRASMTLNGMVYLILFSGCTKDPPKPVGKTPAASQAVPDSIGDYVSAFDQLWSDMDRHYSYFELKRIDWHALKVKYRPQAVAAKTTDELVSVLRAMLAELKDEHIRIEGPFGRIVPYQKAWERNWSIPGIQRHMRTGGMVGQFISIGRMKEGFGLLHMENQSAATPELAEEAVRKIESLADAPGFIVDLRRAVGGNEAHSMPLASAFCAKNIVYAKQKFRSGNGHSDFTPVIERNPLMAGTKPFTKPVVVLLGPAVMSSGEGLAMMFAVLPNVTTLGSATRGSSGNPQPVELKDAGVTVYFSRWVSMLPDGTPIEGHGVIPEVEARFPLKAFGAEDPVLEKAIDLLKKSTASKKTGPEAK